MLRTIEERTTSVIAAAFGYSTPTDSTRSGNPPRDVIFCPADIALRRRAEQSSKLGRDPESHMPFMSFWRTGVEWNKSRANTPLAKQGALTGSGDSYIYTMRPADLIFQAEHWSRTHDVHESAIEKFILWSSPPSEMAVTDENGIVFQLPMWFVGGNDNSQIMKVYDIGEIYRWTFSFRVGGYVIEGSASDTPIETIKTRFLDYGATGETADAVLIKSVDLSE